MRSTPFALLAAIVSLLAANSAEAQPEAYPAPPPPPATPAPPPGQAPPPPPQQYYRPAPMEPTRSSQSVAIYGELLGKGLLYGVGFDINFNKWIGVGGCFSYYKLFDLQAGIVAPYVNFYPVGGIKHSMIIQGGAEIVFASDTSEEFGAWGSGVGAVGLVGMGWEFRYGFMIRIMMNGFFSQYGFLPWPGITLGGAF